MTLEESAAAWGEYDDRAAPDRATALAAQHACAGAPWIILRTDLDRVCAQMGKHALTETTSNFPSFLIA